jgi:hypothetical protein
MVTIWSSALVASSSARYISLYNRIVLDSFIDKLTLFGI